MKKNASLFIMVASLFTLSCISYYIQNSIFHRSDDTFFYMLQDIAFLPIQVVLVTMIINTLLNKREKQALLSKMNMVIGAFFSEMGTDMIRQFIRLDGNTGSIRDLLSGNDWSKSFLKKVKKDIEHHQYKIAVSAAELESVRNFLMVKRQFLMGLLENSNLLEHETFTDLLWAISHLAEELAYRTDLNSLPDSDFAHLAGDIKRAYSLLLV